MLLGNVGCLGKVLARCQQELIFGSSAAILTVGPVLFAFKECHGALLRGPFEDHKNLRRLSLAFHPLNDGRASQIPAPAPLNHLGHILDVVRDPALVRYFDFSDYVIFHAAPAPSLPSSNPASALRTRNSPPVPAMRPAAAPFASGRQSLFPAAPGPVASAFLSP